jgi:shikimate dehydrogenase
VGVIGDPVRHSRSPQIHNAAFAALGIDWASVAFPVPAGRAVAALEGMRALGIEGLSVTMPHKEAVTDAVDRLTEAAAVLGAVNCVARDGDELVGDNTDGPGFLRALAAEAAFDPAGRTVAVVGAGGAARAVVVALAQAGAADVAVVNRTPEAAERAAALAGPGGRVAAPPAIAEVDLVVNATPLGMVGERLGRLPFDPELVHAGQVVADLVYEPAETALLVAVRARGAVGLNGLGMLVHQAALQLERWTGRPAPVDAMTAAVRAGG